MIKNKIVNKPIVVLAIFLILFIINVVLYANLIIYYVSHFQFKITFGMANNFLTIVSAIIILGFISTRLPQFRNLGDSSIYEISYLIMMGILSIIISYFNQSTNTSSYVFPFLDVFKMLSVLVILMLIATKTKPLKKIMNKKETRKDLVYASIVFCILACFASFYSIPVNESFVNVRDLIVLIGGLFGGPIVGVPAGIVAGGFRFLEGGATAVPCALSTVISGIVGSVIYVYHGRRFLKGLSSIVLVFLYTGFQMFLILLMTPENISVSYINKIYLLMLFSSVLGMCLFLMIIKEVGSKNEISYEEFRLNEFENTLDEYENRIDQLEEDLELLKKNNDLE